jgi:tetratricopeptide (TPR) repeat protein
LGQTNAAAISQQRGDEIALKWQEAANQALQVGNYQSSLTHSNMLISHKIFEAWAWNIRGCCLFRLKEFSDALSSFNRALEFSEYSSSPVVLYNKASCLSNLKRYQEAQDYYEKALQQNLDHEAARQAGTDYLKTLPQSLFDSQEYREALSYCDQLIFHKIFEAWAWNTRGNCLYRLKEYNEALSCYNRALEFPESSTDYILLSNNAGCLEALETYRMALDYYEKSLQLNPEFEIARQGRIRVLKSLIRSLFEAQEYQKAIPYTDILISQDVSGAWLWNERGCCLFALQKYNDALSCYNRALEFRDGSTDFVVLCNKADCLSKLNDYESALVWYDKAEQLYPRYVRAIKGKAEMLAAIKNRRRTLIGQIIVTVIPVSLMLLFLIALAHKKPTIEPRPEFPRISKEPVKVSAAKNNIPAPHSLHSHRLPLEEPYWSYNFTKLRYEIQEKTTNIPGNHPSKEPERYY